MQISFRESNTKFLFYLSHILHLYELSSYSNSDFNLTTRFEVKKLLLVVGKTSIIYWITDDGAYICIPIFDFNSLSQ